MVKTQLPDCFYPNKPLLITPKTPTPNYSLYLSNLDDQKYLVKYIYAFKKSVSIERLKLSLSRVLVDYYPLAGRLRTSLGDDQRLEVDCNGEGALFAEGIMDISAEEFVELSRSPDSSWSKLLYMVEAKSFLDFPPLIVQVTNLRCGGMILCTAINHCLCDGMGASQFLHTWAHLTINPTDTIQIPPFHSRHLLKPRNPPRISSTHSHYYQTALTDGMNLRHVFEQQVPSSLTFTAAQIVHLKRQCVPSLKCTTFEALASHTWRSWVKSQSLDPTTHVKLLFSVNVRKKINPELPKGYYGNGFVLGCAEAQVKDLVDANLHTGVKLVQQAKSALTDEYVRSVVDLLEDKTVKLDISRTLIISQWSKLGLEDLDFGEGKPLHMGPLTRDMFCLFLPIIGESNAVRVLLSVPKSSVDRYEYYMRDVTGSKENGYEDGRLSKENEQIYVNV